MSTFQKLYDAPLAVANQFAIVISGSISHVRKKAAEATTLELMQVYAGRPVYATMTPEADRIRVEASGAAGQNTPQVYFLPWAKGSIYRVRPKPGDIDGPNGNLFFTPNLDGCMITVEGTRDAPTIYHSNSAGVKFSDIEEQVLGGTKDLEQQFILEQNLKIANMSRNLEGFKKVLPKSPKATTSEVQKTKDFDMHQYGALPKEDMKFTERGDLELFEQESSYGAVFGVRKGGLWTFYKQVFRTRRREWEVFEESWVPFTKGKMVRKKALVYEVGGAKQFWP